MKTGIEKVGTNYYMNCHQKIHRKYGVAVKCDNPNCKSINPKRFEWALKKGKTYSSNVIDYIQLCPSCHRKYDYNPNQGKSHSAIMKGRKPTNRQLEALRKGKEATVKKVYQFSSTGVLIKEWSKISDAAISLKILNTSISNCITNKSKTAGGFIWKLKN